MDDTVLRTLPTFIRVFENAHSAEQHSEPPELSIP